MARNRAGFVADTFHQVAIGGNDVGVMIYQVFAVFGLQDGLAKAAAGLTTIDEVLRVTQDG